MSKQQAEHWDSAYRLHGAEGASWYQAVPAVSLELLEALRVPRDAAVIDVGGGAAHVADRLCELGYTDVTVLDISATALDEGRRRRGGDAHVRLLHQDILTWRPARSYDLWHDRAVFHFLVADGDRARYLEALRAAIRPDGWVVLATFAPEAPEFCSGLPVARYSVEELTDLLGDGFELLEARREEHVTPRGAIQPFTWLAGRIHAV